MLCKAKDVAKENMSVDLLCLIGHKFVASEIRSNNYYLFGYRSGTVFGS